MSIISMKIGCDICGNDVDKSEATQGFGAMSIIKKEYKYSKTKIKGQELKKTDFDICTECCEKISELIEEIKKAK